MNQTKKVYVLFKKTSKKKIQDIKFNSIFVLEQETTLLNLKIKTMKRLTNTTGLKVKYLAPTNNKDGRYKLTQLNNSKSITINGNLDVAPVEFFSTILENIKEIKTFSLVVDNTQNDYYIFNLDFEGDSFEDILKYFNN